MADHMLVQIHLAPGQSALHDAAAKLGVPVSALDSAYGVVPTDPAAGLFAVMVDKAHSRRAANKLGMAPDDEGIFANPPIAPFGPPES